jgi:hypothetical protein
MKEKIVGFFCVGLSEFPILQRGVSLNDGMKIHCNYNEENEKSTKVLKNGFFEAGMSLQIKLKHRYECKNYESTF